MKNYRAGIDIGSTTVKLVVLDDDNTMIYGNYRRHSIHTQRTLADLLKDARQRLGECTICAKITGSGSINLGKALGIDFEQDSDMLPRRPMWQSNSVARMPKLFISKTVWKKE